jgi:hypothetical protein
MLPDLAFYPVFQEMHLLASVHELVGGTILKLRFGILTLSKHAHYRLDDTVLNVRLSCAECSYISRNLAL